VSDFVAAPDVVRRKLHGVPLQEYTTTSDFPAQVKDIVEKFHILPAEIDNAHEQVFDVKDFRNTKKSGFKVRRMQSALTFVKVLAGEKAKLNKVTGSDITTTFLRYGGGLGYDQTWFDDAEWWLIEDQTAEFRTKWNTAKAAYHIGLIEAVGSGNNVAYQGSGVELLRDIQTINAGCSMVVAKMKASGNGLASGAKFVILAPSELKVRLQAALDNVFHANKTGVTAKVMFPVTAVYSPNFATTTSYYVCSPKGLIKSGNRMDMKVFTKFDELAYSTNVVAWGRFGATVGSYVAGAAPEQISRCATS
jgi:hypothetical protein